MRAKVPIWVGKAQAADPKIERKTRVNAKTHRENVKHSSGSYQDMQNIHPTHTSLG